MSRRLAGRFRRDDTGAFAILYAVLVTVLCMIVAMVVDLGMLRTDRRSEKSASDNAAVAGAFYINQLDPNSPADACFNAFDYVRANLTDDGNTFVRPSCAVLNGACTPDVTDLAGSYLAGSPERHATGTAGRYTVAITYPVSDNSVLMHADVAPGTGPQILDLARDGNSCQRVAVEVLGKRPFVFALVNKFKSGTTNVHSVARTEFVRNRKVVAPLVTLDPVSCTTLEVTGQGGVTVLANNDDPLDTYPGGIAVDSNGSAGSGAHDCTASGSRYTLDANDGPNGFIHAESTSDGRLPSIYSYALAGSFAAKAYEPSDVSGCTSTTPPIPTSVDLCPRPETLGKRLTRSPWDLRYNCTVPNPDCSAPYINNLVASLDGPGAPSVNGSWTILPNSAWATADKKKFCGETGGQTAQSFPTGNYYITCSTLSMKVNYSFGPGSTLVLAGGLSMETRGCFALGVDAAQRDPLCAGTLAPTAVPSPADSIIYVRNKADLVRQAQASLFLFHTFVYQTGGVGDTTGRLSVNSGTGALYWTAPASSVPGVWGDFKNLLYWNEAAATDSNPFYIGGQAGLYLEGTMFMPNAVFEYHGDGNQRQITAQFVAWRLLSSGQANLDLKPDNKRTLAVPISGVHLIR